MSFRLREMHLINQGDQIVYTSLIKYQKAVIFIESKVKDVHLVYHQSLQAAMQVDEFTVKQLELLMQESNYVPAFDCDIMVLWKN